MGGCFVLSVGVGVGVGGGGDGEFPVSVPCHVDDLYPCIIG